MRVVADRSRDRAQPSIGQAETPAARVQPAVGQPAPAAARRRAGRGQSAAISRTIDLATPQQSGAIILFLVAYYGLLASVMGGMAVALDTTAGERERQSLEPLLMTPARPLELVAGKWLAVAFFNALVVIVTLAGFYLTLVVRAAACGRRAVPLRPA